MTGEVTGQGTGNAQFTPEGRGDQSQSQPQYITVDEAKKLTEQAVQEAVSKAQSLVDKSGNRVQARVQERLKELEATLKMQADAGIEVTPAQKKALQQQVVVDALAEEPGADPNAQSTQKEPPQAPPGQGEQIDPITQAAWTMMQERGVDILESDPEFKILDMSSPYKFLLSVDKAISAKETRVQSSSEEPNQMGSNPHARIPGAGAGGSSSNLMPDGTPAIDRLDAYFRKTRGR